MTENPTRLLFFSFFSPNENAYSPPAHTSSHTPTRTPTRSTAPLPPSQSQGRLPSSLISIDKLLSVCSVFYQMFVAHIPCKRDADILPRALPHCIVYNPEHFKTRLHLHTVERLSRAPSNISVHTLGLCYLLNFEWRQCVHGFISFIGNKTISLDLASISIWDVSSQLHDSPLDILPHLQQGLEATCPTCLLRGDLQENRGEK